MNIECKISECKKLGIIAWMVGCNNITKYHVKTNKETYVSISYYNSLKCANDLYIFLENLQKQ